VNELVQHVVDAVADTKTTDADKVFLLRDISNSLEQLANSRKKLLVAMPPSS
tara:strand:- start:535 stop:690 length:156 start_codon:yes stop_codon:yes gene_type:complete